MITSFSFVIIETYGWSRNSLDCKQAQGCLLLSQLFAHAIYMTPAVPRKHAKRTSVGVFNCRHTRCAEIVQ